MLGALGLLAAAIAAEVGATTALPRTEGFRAPAWSVAVVAGYALSIWLLSLVVRDMSVSTAYAVWAGVGTTAIVAVGVLFRNERLDWVSAGAITLIVLGVVVLNLHSSR